MDQKMKSLTLDLDSVGFYSSEAISKNILARPDGSIVCLGVPIARTGEMIYGGGETPIRPGPDGFARVTRDDAALTCPDTVASFAGVPVTDDHPPESVSSANWGKYAVGTVVNPRPGEMEGDASVKLILADLIISDKSAVQAVLSGKREVSCGYDADYDQTGEGQGRQSNIIGNHVALVEKGRCGPRCSIRDSATKPQAKGPSYMTQAKSILEKARSFFRDAETELEKLAETVPSGEKEVHLHFHGGGPDQLGKDESQEGAPQEPEVQDEDPVEQRFAALESGHQEILAKIAELAEKLAALSPTGDQEPDEVEGEGEEVKDEAPEGELEAKDKCGTNDSAALVTGWNKLVADVEILVPGFRMPTFDAKAKRKSTVDNMCQLRRNAMASAYQTNSGKTIIDAVSGNQDIASMTCDQAAVVFTAAVGAKRLENNRALVGDAKRETPKPAGSTITIAEMQARHNAFWAGRK